ncbi:hypothetical protein ACFLRY_05390, partial [Bacteroidota bacterium]
KHHEFEASGAEIVKDVKEADVVFGVKEMPIDFFQDHKTYIFFSHVIKGQSYNMPMLKKMMEKKCNLIDYEKIADDSGKRLIFFGRFAGLAGMINSLWSLGQRYKELGIETPFSVLRQSHTYESLEEAKEEIRKVGMKIASEGLPEEICPLTIALTGYGNVSLGAQEIAALLPSMEISPEELLKLKDRGDIPNNVVYKTVFKEWDLSQPDDDKVEFELQHYYSHPELYHNEFEKYVPHISVLMNCMYWDDKYPRILTKDFLEKLYKEGNMKLTVIGDVTCDPDGSIECTHMGTYIEDPVFVYNPLTQKATMGFKGEGILDMAVDILPSELPREASMAFSNALLDYVEDIALADYSVEFEKLDLPAPIKRAMILHNGELTPDYQYIREYINA